MKNIINDYSKKRMLMPLKSWDIFSQFTLSEQINISNNNDLANLKYFASVYNWKNSIEKIINTNDYEAIVLTDISKKILWVSDGFENMTGYSKEYAKNKRPVFLQGKNSKEKREAIRQKLALNQPFKECITNYKKDGSKYDCELYIIPLKNDKTTHYLALEKAV